ncbi:MAG: MMPL family transporter, partial [Deltaproteobacteria bacterium]|nr:MMPL family transporter [Deltaproteobacteria bacterium]
MISKKIVSFSVNRPKLVIIFSLAIILALGIQIRKIKVDTDPENILSSTEPVRLSHNETKKEFNLHDFIIVGIVNEHDPDGVFNPKSLDHIYSITQQIEKIPGVITNDLMSPSTMEAIIQAGPGAVRFEWLMDHPPKDRQGALEIRQRALDNPLLKGTLVSEDGKAISLFIPLEHKDISYKVSRQIRQIIQKYSDQEKFYITGLPVAEDTFGMEMFRQISISTPLAALIIFLILWIFFKKISLIISPMLVAGMSVASAMGLLIGMGYPVHIMSSMIPIFLIPIAVVDSVHILSEFYDLYPQYKDQKKTILKVMDHLFMPMLYTSLTSAVGFASLAFTPIPSVRLFGVMVAFGIIMAWVLTITFIPAYIMMIPADKLRHYGDPVMEKGEGKKISLLEKFISFQGKLTWRHEKIILSLTIGIIILSIIGITRLNINDNPVKWFTRSHPIRVADRVL